MLTVVGHLLQEGVGEVLLGNVVILEILRILNRGFILARALFLEALRVSYFCLKKGLVAEGVLLRLLYLLIVLSVLLEGVVPLLQNVLL